MLWYSDIASLLYIAALCFASEYLNEWAANNYKWVYTCVSCSAKCGLYVVPACRLFSEEQYFDSSGFFIFVIFAVPVVFNCLLIVVQCKWNAPLYAYGCTRVCSSCSSHVQCTASSESSLPMHVCKSCKLWPLNPHNILLGLKLSHSSHLHVHIRLGQSPATIYFFWSTPTFP